MGKIVALGGGELRDSETRAIDQRIIDLTGKSSPQALFIPTASGDATDYYATFQAHYGDQLGCKTDVLYLINNRLPADDIAAKIERANLIYVGGGNTLRMMKLWRKRGVDRLLETAYQSGTVLSGISAGAICWFAYGFSDSRSFSSNESWNYIRVRGLGLVNAIYCPHIDGEKRLAPFTQFMHKYNLTGIGCDDNCALEIVDGEYRFITSQPGAKGYRVYKRGSDVITETLTPDADFEPLTALLAK